MKCTLVGIQDVNFQSKDGKAVDGVKLHYCHATDNVVGYKANTGYVSRNVFNSFGLKVDELATILNSVIDLEFDPNGKICGITC